MVAVIPRFLSYLFLLSINIATAQAVELAPGLVGEIHEAKGKLRGLVIIAPGAGYDMNQPLFVDIGSAAANEGYRVLRFNWRYYSAGKKRQSGIEAEVQDLKQAVDYLRQSTKGNIPVTLVGKSLGSIVVANVAKEIGSNAILLTPICRSPERFKAFYQATDKTVVMISGDEDPLCDQKILFENVDAATKVAIVKGDHGYNSDSEEQSKRNKSLVVKTVQYWLSAF